ncbi:MAG: hypothetical protein WC227_01080 [Patescibacteria group bacterium]|jgi:hypothetical protein
MYWTIPIFLLAVFVCLRKKRKLQAQLKELYDVLCATYYTEQERQIAVGRACEIAVLLFGRLVENSLAKPIVFKGEKVLAVKLAVPKDSPCTVFLTRKGEFAISPTDDKFGTKQRCLALLSHEYKMEALKIAFKEMFEEHLKITA